MRRTAIMMIVVGALIFALTAATAMAAPGKGGGKGPSKPKVVMCHKGKTITVSSSAVKGHQKHGDPMGACAVTAAPGGGTTAPEATAPETTQPETSTPETTQLEDTTLAP